MELNIVYWYKIPIILCDLPPRAKREFLLPIFILGFLFCKKKYICDIIYIKKAGIFMNLSRLEALVTSEGIEKIKKLKVLVLGIGGVGG